MELYIHIPFCVRKCGYCDFLSFPAGQDLQEKYIDCLLSEIQRFAGREDVPFGGGDKIVRPRVSSVFFGGGTPSVLPGADIARVMEALREAFSIEENAEISIEANPGTVTADKLKAYRACGINRISFGLQSANNAELQQLGRIHTFEKFEESFSLARAAGFRNINVDVMSAIPGQTEASWAETLEKTAAMGPEHLSAYSLILEEGTPFYKKYSNLEKKIEAGESAEAVLHEEKAEGLLPAERLPDEETERRMYEETAEILGRFGYQQYEISNYAKTGYACRHNIGYWTGVPYYGFGLGASSYLPLRNFCLDAGSSASDQNADSRKKVAVRFKNTDRLQQYLDRNFAKQEIETLTAADARAEYMILGLRMTAGISEQDFFHRFGCLPEEVYGKQIRKYEDAKLLRQENGRIFLTREGISLSNVVMADFL